MKTPDRKFHLKTPIELGRMTTNELLEYIDKLHGVVREYQIVINVAMDKNQNVGPM